MKMMSKFRANRQEREHGGQRAQAHEMGMGADVPPEQEEQLEEEIHPGIHDEVENVAAEHGPAMETHTTHDHEGGVHHTHTIHPDGYEHHADHATADEAHLHAAKMAGVEVPEGKSEEHGEHHSKSKHKAEHEEADEYEAEPLD